MPLTTVQSGMMDSVAQYYSFKNKLINGQMAIDQRNNGSSVSAATGILTYCIDRFYLYQTGAGVTGQRVASGVTGYQYAFRVTGATSNTYSEFSQRIESNNTQDLVGQNVTVSFTAAHSASGTIYVTLVNPTAADNYTSTTVIGSTAVVMTSTMTRYSVTFNSMPSGVANGLLVIFANSSGLTAGQTFTITGTQVEKGVTATSFDYRPYTTELQLCQRYYEKSYNVDVVPGTATNLYANKTLSSTAFILSQSFFPCKVTKRASGGTVTIYSYVTGASGFTGESNTGGVYVADRAGSVNYISSNGFGFQATAGAYTTGNFQSFEWTLSSEL